MSQSHNQEIRQRTLLNKHFQDWYAQGHSTKPPDKLQHCCVSFALEVAAIRHLGDKIKAILDSQEQP